MKNRWRDADAKAFLKKYAREGSDLALRTYSARLIGQDPALVLHGGGNTSVKTRLMSVTRDPIDVLCVKGSGWNLDTIEPAGHPAVRFEPLKRLRVLPNLFDEEMVNQLRINMLDSKAPNPSVETLLHAFLPHKFIDHSHANAVLSIVDQRDAARRVSDWVDGKMGVVPYIMPGFALSKLAAEIFEKQRDVEGLILLQHGIFTFGATAEESYVRMIRWVDSAEKQLAKSRPVSFSSAYQGSQLPLSDLAAVSNILRGELSRAGMPLFVSMRESPEILRFVNSRESAVWSQRGPATPDHVIRTKPLPLRVPAYDPNNIDRFRKQVRSAIQKFIRAYQSYFSRQSHRKKVIKKALDPLPRILLVPGAGLFAAAENWKAVYIALDVYETTIGIIDDAARIGRYQPIPEGDIFDMEYWSLEQAKLGKLIEKPFSRQVVWISGAASGIGLATAKAFAEQGAQLFLTDQNVEKLKRSTDFSWAPEGMVVQQCDVTSAKQVRAAFQACSMFFGGVDVVVSNAGVAPTGNVADVSDEILRKSFEINFFAHQYVAQAAVDVFRRQGTGGVLLFNASKSAFNPGPGFGPYTLPKAGVIALMKQYAVELGADGIRCNAVNADRVRTGLYAKGLLKSRARARGVTVEQYMSGNLLQQQVYAEDVAAAFVWLAQAAKTTGAVIPVDGGNAAAFPR